MVTDIVPAFEGGFRMGQSILNTNLRQQELQSQLALRQLQEQQSAAETQLVLQHVEQAKQQIANTNQYRAEMQTAMAQHQIDTSPTWDFQEPLTGQTTTFQKPAMSEEDSLMKNVVPVIAKHEPEKLPSTLQAMAMIPYRRAAADYFQQRPDIAREVEEGRNQRATDRLQAQFEQLQQKHQDALDMLDLKQTHDFEMQDKRNEARLAIAQGQVSREQWMNRHLNATMKSIADTKAGAKLSAQEQSNAALKLLGDAWDMEIGARRQGTTQPLPEGGGAAPVAIPPPAPPSSNEVIRYYKGRRVVYDAKTHKPLRYAD